MTGRTFADLFGEEPIARASAPGRVNMLGDHTDYNDGYVLPVATPQRTSVQLSLGAEEGHQVYSAHFDQLATIGDPHAPSFVKYIGGCIALVEEHGHIVPPLRLRIESNVPVGVGLSSSAALEVALLRGLNLLLGFSLTALEIAQMAQQAELRFAGVECGIMDQMAASMANTREMLFLDTRSMETRLVPFPEGSEFIVVDSGITRRLRESAYNERRNECRQAAQMLGIETLRDVDDENKINALPEVLQRRVRHVLRENERVLTAIKADAQRFGELMNQSHESLRDDYEVSIPQLDKLVAALQASQAVFGARMTGAGFGGACVALVRSGSAAAIKEYLHQQNMPGVRMLIPSLNHDNAAHIP